MPLLLLISFLICNALVFGQYTPIFPAGVVTDADLGVVSYRAASTLAAQINSIQTTIQVQPGHGALFAVNNFIIIDAEKMLITSKNVDQLTVVRAFAQTTAALHLINAPVVNATLPDYPNRMASEMKAVQGNVLIKGNNLSDITNAATARTNIGAAPLASPTFTGTVTAPAFSGPLTGAVTGNATTATSASGLSANPGNCPTNQAAGGVSASGAAEACLDLPALYQSLDQDLTALSALIATAGITARTGAGTFAVRTLTGTANEVTITNGDGASANPTFSIAATVDLSGKTSTKPMKVGTAPPACTQGDFFFDTDATAGSNVLGCVGTSWITQGGGSGDMLKSENLLGLTNTATARTNLGVAIGSNVQAFDADLTGMSALVGTGLVARTAANTFLERNIAGSATITVTNQDGVAGNPTISIPDGAISPAKLSEFARDDSFAYCSDAGSTDAYACSLSPAITGYFAGVRYRLRANTANTGAATVNFNAMGVKTIKKATGGITTDLADNDIRAGQFIELAYDGTNMQMQSTLGNAPVGGGAIGTANQVSGTNAAANAVEQKSVLAGANITVTHGVGTITIGGSTASGTALNVVSTATHGSDPTGVANSATAFINALAAVAVQGTVVVPCGIYRLDQNIIITSKHLRAAFPRCATVNRNFNGNNTFELDGTDGSLTGFIVNANRTGFPTTGQGVTVKGTRNWVINNEIKESAAGCVYVTASDGAQIRDNLIHSCNNWGVYGQENARYTKIDGNTIRNLPDHCVGFHSYAVGQNVDGTEVTNNTMEISGGGAFCVEIGSFLGDYPEDIKVTDNKCRVKGTAFGGYSIANTFNALISQNQYDAEGNQTNYCMELFGSDHMSVIGNTCKGMSNTNTGLQVDRSFQYGTIIGNTIEGFRPWNGIAGTEGKGIQLNTSQSGQPIHGNIIMGNTVLFTPGDTGGWCIDLGRNNNSSFTSFNIVANNFCYGSGTGVETYGIRVMNNGGAGGVTENNVVEGNIVRNVKYGLYLGVQTLNTTLRNNFIDAPIPQKITDSSLTPKGLIMETSGESIRINSLGTATTGTGGFVCVDGTGKLYRKTTACNL